MGVLMTNFVIKKAFHFYAAHRNEDHPACHPCFSIHGHTFYVDCYLSFGEQDEAGVTKLFSEIEAMIKPVIDRFDHSLIMNASDSLYEVLKDKGMKLCIIDRPSSAENLAKIIFDMITETVPLDLVQLDFRETPSSLVIYRKPQASKGETLSIHDAVRAVEALA
jgi:6-pyruvoyl tetrahydropterin synthase/QueD family protein